MSSETLTLIQLNLWYGRLYYPLKDFFEQENADILLAQEVLSCAVDPAPTYMTAQALAQIGNFTPPVFGGTMPWMNLRGHDMPTSCCGFHTGTLTLLSENIVTPPMPPGCTEQEPGRHIYNSLLHVTLRTQSGHVLHALTHHGFLVRNEGRMGHAYADAALGCFADYIAGLEGAVVFTGDFNLLKEAASMQPLKAIGLENLNDRFNISAVRNEFAWRQDESVCHVFINDRVQVQDYDALMSARVSDHAPMRLRFHVK